MGCYLNLKQELYRKLKKLIPNENNNFNLNLIKRLNISKLKLIQTHNYFRRVFEIFCQNINWINNAFERYNRRFGELFINAHPNLSAFLIAIRNEFEFYSERCHQIRKNNKSIKYDNGNISKPEIDPEYAIWKL
ncbi:hypothetical protein HZS_5178 [Henneguya salminicola]|nr:hypothetical protein HZS_5178 [Henneguya salminicola]